MPGHKDSRRANQLRTALQWLRQVAPPGWTIGLVVAFVAMIQAVACIDAAFESWELASRLHDGRDGLLIFAAGAYGLYRALRSHPLFHKEYREFLARTPWDRRHPLPLSPLVLVPQDAILLGLLLLPFAFRPELSPVLVPLVFLFTHLLVLILALLLTGEPWFAWFVALGLALSIRLSWVGPWPQLFVLAITYPIAWWGVWRSLAAFPWDGRLQELSDWRQKFLESRQKSPGNDKSRRELDVAQFWPWKSLSFDSPERLVDARDAWAWSALAGFLLYGLLTPVGNPPDEYLAREYHSTAAMSVVLGAATLSLVRLIVYVSACQSPLSLWGRIRLGQYLIPAYDVVAVTPLIVLLLGLSLYSLLALLGVPLPIGEGMCTAILLGITFTGGPRLRKWQLTAPARLTPMVRPQGEVEAI
jgi:hypothetical protein